MNRQEIIKSNNKSVVKDFSVTEVTEKSADYIGQVDYIDFAVIFGSFAEGKVSNLSDIDIGIFINTDISLIERGSLTTRLESILKKDVDIAVLNGLYKKNPALAYEIISKGRLIVCRKQEKLTEFKKNTFLYFMDTQRLRGMIDRAFKERLNNGRFGERNYA